MNDLLVDLRSQRAALIATMVRDGYGGDSLRKLADLQGSIAAIEAVLRRLANTPAKRLRKLGSGGYTSAAPSLLAGAQGSEWRAGLTNHNQVRRDSTITQRQVAI